MSDQQAPQNGDTPAVAGPTEAPGTAHGEPPYGDPNDPAEKRYEHLRSWTDRVAQENAELRTYKDRVSEAEQRQQWYDLALTTDDPDTQRQALQHLGFDVPDEVEDVEPAEYEDEGDPYADLQRQIAEERQWRQNIEEAAADAAAHEFLEDHVKREFQRLGIDKLDGQSQEMVKRLIPSAPGIPTPPGSPHEEVPDVEAIWGVYQAEMDRGLSQWAKTKRSAPHVSPGGLPANEVPNPGTGHNARMDRASRALMEQQE